MRKKATYFKRILCSSKIHSFSSMSIYIYFIKYYHIYIYIYIQAQGFQRFSYMFLPFFFCFGSTLYYFYTFISCICQSLYKLFLKKLYIKDFVATRNFEWRSGQNLRIYNYLLYMYYSSILGAPTGQQSLMYILLVTLIFQAV